MKPLAFHLENVSKTFEHFMLRDIDLELPRGSIMGLVGPNGAGKSTTMRILLGLLGADAGRVELVGYSIPKEQIEAKRRVGFVSEDMRLYGRATVGWHMQFVRSLYPSWDQAYAMELLRRFDLLSEQKVKQLSHGQGVKAALLLTLARLVAQHARRRANLGSHHLHTPRRDSRNGRQRVISRSLAADLARARSERRARAAGGVLLDGAQRPERRRVDGALLG